MSALNWLDRFRPASGPNRDGAELRPRTFRATPQLPVHRRKEMAVTVKVSVIELWPMIVLKALALTPAAIMGA